MTYEQFSSSSIPSNNRIRKALDTLQPWNVCHGFIWPLAALLITAVIGSSQPLDVVVTLDNSGSMRQNDPRRLMPEAISTFARTLPIGAHFGIALFDKTPKVVVHLTPVESAAFPQAVAAGLRLVDYHGQLTDIPGGLESALYELRERGREGARHVIVLFTDGYIDTGGRSRDEDRARWLRDDLLPEAARRQVMVISVAFTDQADFQLMQSVAQKTGGLYFKAQSGSEINAIFSRIENTLRQDDAAVRQQQRASALSTERHQPSAGRRFSLWLSMGIGVLLAVGAATAYLVTRSRRQYLFFPSLHDQGRHTAQPVYFVRTHITRIGCVRRPTWKTRNHIVMPYPTVSRRHAELVFERDTVFLTDLSSTNHTYRNGKKVPPGSRIELQNGDLVRFDAYEFRFVAGGQKTILASDNALDVQRPEDDLGSKVSKITPPDEQETLVKPLFCENHSGTRPVAQCPICDKVLCNQCLESWASHTICARCRDYLISSAPAEEVQQILIRLGRISGDEDPTLVKPE